MDCLFRGRILYVNLNSFNDISGFAWDEKNPNQRKGEVNRFDVLSLNRVERTKNQNFLNGKETCFKCSSTS